MEIDATCLPLELARTVSDVLWHVSSVDSSGLIEPDGAWQSTVGRVVIRRVIAGGRSGATVLDADVHRIGYPRPDRRVIKVSPAEKAAREWRALQAAIYPRRPHRLFVPVDAVSTAIDQPDLSLTDLLAAVVYHHVTEFAYRPHDEVIDLEQLVRDRPDADDATEVIRILTDRLRDGLWVADRPQAQTLRRFNNELGVDLELDIDEVTANGTLTYGNPSPDQRRTMLRTSDEVLEAATRLDPAGAGPIKVGSMVELRGIAPARVTHDVIEGRLGDVRVQIRCATGTTIDLTRHADLNRPRPLVVVGMVAATRTHRWWDRVVRLESAISLDGDALELEEIRVRQPFARLCEVLTAVVPDRLAGTTHGDLNPRNVLVVGGLVYLIDFARAGNRPPMSDAAFLELCLLRDVIAAELGWKRLVRLQRLLGVAARMVESARDGWDAAQSLATGDAAVDRAFQVLWAVRSGARHWYRDQTQRPGWWREYLSQLSLASIRTLKWSDDLQDRAAIHAVLAAAGVAAEWLGEDLFRYWTESDLRLVTRQLVPNLDPAAAETGDALAEIVTAIDGRGLSDRDDNDLARPIDLCRDAYLRSRFAEAARMVRVERDVAHAEYIGLRALPGRRVDAPRDPDGPADRLAPIPAPLDAHDAVEAATESESALLVILGEAGSGKTTVARELQYRLASAVLSAGSVAPRVPVTLMAADVSRTIETAPEASIDNGLRQTARKLLGAALGDQAEALLVLGGVHITVDGLNEIEASQRSRVAEWIRTLHQTYRRTRIVVCHRVNGFVREELPFPILHLQKVSDQQARAYVRDHFRALDKPDYDDLASALIRALFDDEVNAPVRDLAQTPLFLWMIAERYAGERMLPSHVGDLFDGFTRWSLQGSHDGRANERRSRADFSYPHCVRALGLIARHLFDHDNVTDLPETTAVRLLRAIEPRAEALLNCLVDADMLVRAGANLRFRLHSFQEYFAAVTLREEEDDNRPAFIERVLTFKQREALQIMFRFAGGSPGLAKVLVDVAIRADPVFAAQLLRWIDQPDPADIRRFLDAQARTLAEPSGDFSWRAAVTALNDFGTDDARRLLRQVAEQQDATATDAGPAHAPDARRHGRSFVRSAALAALLRMRSATRFERARPALDKDATTTVTALLDEATDQDVRIEAIEAVSDARIMSLVAYLAGLVHPRQPWPVLRAACRSLLSLDQTLEPGQHATYVKACATRLPACEAELLRAIDTVTVADLQDERWELLEVLTDAGRLDLVMAARFAFGTADDLYWSDFSRRTREPVPTARARKVWHVLHDDLPAEELVARFAAGDNLTATAAAHRILADRGGPVDALVERVRADSAPEKLLAVAATVPHLEAGGQARIRTLVRDLITNLRPDRLEALASLLGGLPPDDFATKRLLLEAMIAFRRQLPDSDLGVLERLFLDSRRWTGAEIATTLAAGEEGRDLVINGFSMILYPNDARWLQHPEMLPEAIEVLDRHEPRTHADRLAFVRACTAAGLVSGLGHAREIAADPATAQLTVTTANRQYGVERVAALGEVLACIGYLGRRAFDTGHRPASQAAYEYLSGFDSGQHDRTVERGRLIGLGVLGDWSPLLTSLWTDDRPMHRAARNAIDLWTPGPFTPNWGNESADIATWIGTRLHRAGRDLAPDIRSTLCEAKEMIERDLGRIVQLP